MPKTTLEMSEAEELPWTLTSLNCKRCPHLCSFLAHKRSQSVAPECGSPYWDREHCLSDNKSEAKRKGENMNFQ